MNNFEVAIKTYLDSFAKVDSHFKKCYENPEKNIKQCCSYIIGQVRKAKRIAFCNDEVFQMARHYYLEEIDSKDLTSNLDSCEVVCDISDEIKEEPKIIDLESFF